MKIISARRGRYFLYFPNDILSMQLLSHSQSLHAAAAVAGAVRCSAAVLQEYLVSCSSSRRGEQNVSEEGKN
jgi:hypothetical protein